MDIALASLIVAIVAIAISAATAVRQLNAARSSTHTTVAIDILRQRLEGIFRDSERFVREDLPEMPVQPIATMPRPARDHALRVASLYQMIGYLCAARAVDPKIMDYMFGVDAVRSWRSLQPYIEAQPAADSGGVGYRFFEDLAFRCSSISATETVRRFRLRSFSVDD